VARSTDVSPRPALLGLLMTGPKHGYELYQDFSQALGRVWRLGRSNLYAQLKELAAAGWVTVEEELQPGRPPRQVYYLTETGRRQFLDWLHRPTPHLRHIRLEFLTRLYFFELLALPGVEALVEQQRSLLQSRCRTLKEAVRRADNRFDELVLTFRLGQMEAVIEWLDHCSST
jgi:PadR family transcriptional regulator, regulatory protein AphA